MWRSTEGKTLLTIGVAVIVGLSTAKFIYKLKRRRKMTRIIDTIEEFQKPSVRIRDPQRVEEIVCQLISDGKNKLQVIADFDHTLSRFHKNGMRCESCHGALSNSSLMPKEYQEETKALFQEYHPIEINPQLSLEEKAPFMLEWWEKSHSIFMKNPVNKDDIKNIVQFSKVILRDGVDWFLNTLDNQSVPLLILSAGLGDVLVEVIKQQSALHKNITTIANFMEFNANGISGGFIGETIHTCNKSARTVWNTGYFEAISERRNVMVLGDSLGDLGMVEGVDKPGAVLKIGFLNQQIDEYLPQYMEGYDIVLVDDQTMDVVNGLLRKVLG